MSRPPGAAPCSRAADDLVLDVARALARRGRDLSLGAGDELVVDLLVAALGFLDQVGLGVVAEDEPHPVVVPAVELGGEREVGVAPQADLVKPGLAAQGDRPVVVVDHALVAGPVGAQQPQVQGFFGVRERDHQRRVPPDAVVGDVHPLLGLSIGGHDRGVGVDHRRLLEERAGLAAPHLQPGAVDRLLQGDDRGCVEAPA